MPTAIVPATSEHVMWLRTVVLVALAAVMPAVLAGNPPAFEVAAITPNHSGGGRNGNKGTIRSLPGGRFTAINVTLRELIDAAYQLEPSAPLTGAPSWVDSDRFDVVAKAPGNVDDGIRDAVKDGGAKEKVAATRSDSPSDEQLMLRALLAERFKLVLRTESREQPIYALTLVRSNGQVGPQLTRSTVDCGTTVAGKGGKLAACGVKTGPGMLTARGTTMAQIAASLSEAVHRTVADRTGLTGAFDASLMWTPDQAQSPGPRAAPSKRADPNGPSLFTALQEELGLKLESARGAADAFAVDHVVRPAFD